MPNFTKYIDPSCISLFSYTSIMEVKKNTLPLFKKQ